MVEQFKDDFTPIEVELTDADGKKEIKRSVFLSAKEWRKAYLLLTDEKETDSITKMCGFLGAVFGEKPESFEKYSSKLLTAVVKYYGDKAQKQFEPQSA